MTDQPIPVAEAIEAVKAALEVCNRAKVHAGTLEYLMGSLDGLRPHDRIGVGSKLYAAVAPIVEWYRQTGVQGGEL